jgi:hypothetical protein
MTRIQIQQKIINSLTVHLEHPQFSHEIFRAISNERILFFNKRSESEKIAEEDFHDLSSLLTQSELQEPCSVRNTTLSRLLAQHLIDEKGDIKTVLISELILAWEKHLYSLAPGCQYDGVRRERILGVLKALQQNKKIGQLLKKFTRVTSNRQVENLIKETLDLPLSSSITDSHVRQAVLAALFCYLRQNIGSCFATAPAEIIHDEQPEQFLLDLLDLFTAGQLKRVFGGVDHTVPLSNSWGNGDLRRPIPVKWDGEILRPKIGLSPALIRVFESIQIFEPNVTSEEISNKIDRCVIHLIHSTNYSVITPETIIKSVLLDYYNINETQLQEYQTRPKEGVMGELVINTPKLGKEKGPLSYRCQAYLSSMEIAANVFKRFADNPLLKAWEFTLASFAENKLEFTKWNLYASLGLASQEPGGIGECLFKYIQDQMDIVNLNLEEIQISYEASHAYLQVSRSRLERAVSEQEAEWAKIDYQNRLAEFKNLEDQKLENQNRANAWVHLHDSLHKIYLYLFKDYFQEVYDADTKSEVDTRFDDSPAGFRLIFKHGRSNSSLWTWIKTPTEFIDSLCSFFITTEPIVIDQLDFKDMQREFSNLITAVIQHVKTPQFLESAFDRMAAAHQMKPMRDPLENLDKIDKKPWAYTSGGTMNTLIQCYYKLEESPKEESRWVESEVELLIFIIDCLKQISPNTIKPYLTGERQSLLMQSPTHAFLLKPNHALFKSMWTNDVFTYTYVRDNYIQPSLRFIENIELTAEMMQYLVRMLSEKVHENYRHRFKDLFRYIHHSMNPIEFRNQLIQFLDEDRGLRFTRYASELKDELDSLLFRTLPLFPCFELKNRLRQMLIILPEISEQQVENIMDLFDKIPTSIGRYLLGSDELQTICKALISLERVSNFSRYDWSALISQAAQKLEFAMPAPLIFADTNWMKDQFAFLVSPGTGKLELWRVDYIGRRGYPMTLWKHWVDGSRSDIKWMIYTLPYQYGQT